MWYPEAMKIPQVVIVGRPNVGKSSVLNWLAGRRIAIVDDQAGVTRDRVKYLMEADDRFFELVDTGGIGIRDLDDLTDEVEQQIATGIEQADLLLFVVDSQAGILPLDEEVARRLRVVDKPVICLANKADSEARDLDADEFHRLGFQTLLRVSTKANRHRNQLMAWIQEHLPVPNAEGEEPEQPEMKVAIVGRRNVGKSTFVNSLVKDERMIVSEVPGTTRDSVDVRFELDGKAFVAIDTPGLRRSVSVRSDMDYYGVHRAKRSIRRADVVLIFFDAAEPIGRVDKQLCHYVAEHHRPCIFVVNKWDLVKGKAATEEWAQYLRDTFGTMWHVPVAFITGLTGKNIKNLMNHAQMLFKQSRTRITTGQLNGLIKKAIQLNPPPLYRNRRPKVFYATQIAIQPPTIVLVCNQPAAFGPTYRRYLLGVLRDQMSFGEVPIRLFFHSRGNAEANQPSQDVQVADG